MNLIERIQSILLKPKETWPVIEQEGSEIKTIYQDYLVYLAAIPAIAGFIGMSLIGASAFGVSFRVPIVSGLVNMVVGYALSLVMVYVLALIANALAPTFKGEKNLPNAFKLIAYGATAGMVGGIFSLLPVLSILGVLAALYSIYLIYTGIPVLMKSPSEKSLGYTAVLILCGIVAGVVLGAASALFTQGAGMGGSGIFGSAKAPRMSGSGDLTLKIPGTEITLDSSKIEAASRRMEEAQSKGDAEAAGKAMEEMMGAVMGSGKGGQPFAPETLRNFTPDSLGDFTRTSMDARTEGGLGMTFSSVTAEYVRNDSLLEVKLQDIGAVPALMMAMGGWTNSTIDRETQDEVERVYKKDGVSVKEEYRKDGSSVNLELVLANGVMVSVSGGQVDIGEVREVISSLDLKRLGNLAR
jgi:hypothetical protein